MIPEVRDQGVRWDWTRGFEEERCGVGEHAAAAAIIAAITTSRAHEHLPCKLAVAKDSPEGRAAGLRLDSVVDCQILATLPRDEIVHRLGTFPPELMHQIDDALRDALGLTAAPGYDGGTR